MNHYRQYENENFIIFEDEKRGFTLFDTSLQLFK